MILVQQFPLVVGEGFQEGGFLGFRKAGIVPVVLPGEEFPVAIFQKVIADCLHDVCHNYSPNNADFLRNYIRRKSACQEVPHGNFCTASKRVAETTQKDTNRNGTIFGDWIEGIPILRVCNELSQYSKPDKAGGLLCSHNRLSAGALPGAGVMLALTGGEGFSHDDGWAMHPPFSLFGCAEKRKRAVHGPKEKSRWGENLTCVKFRPKYGGWPEPVPM